MAILQPASNSIMKEGECFQKGFGEVHNILLRTKLLVIEGPGHRLVPTQPSS